MVPAFEQELIASRACAGRQMDSPWYCQRTLLPSSGSGASERLCPSEGFPGRGATKMPASKWEVSLATNPRHLQLVLRFRNRADPNDLAAPDVSTQAKS